MFQLSVAGRPRDLPTSHTDSHQVKYEGGGGGVNCANQQKKTNAQHFNQIGTKEVPYVQQLFNKKARLEVYTIFASAANGQWDCSVAG